LRCAWDSKLLPGLTGNDTVDRLPVIITAPNVEQLLGVPQLSSGKGMKYVQLYIIL